MQKNSIHISPELRNHYTALIELERFSRQLNLCCIHEENAFASTVNNGKSHTGLEIFHQETKYAFLRMKKAIQQYEDAPYPIEILSYGVKGENSV